MIRGKIKITLYYTDDEIETNVTIFLKDGDIKKQIEEFIIATRNVKKYTDDYFINLTVDSIEIIYDKKEILDVSKLDI